jgi:hypothetical protein
MVEDRWTSYPVLSTVQDLTFEVEFKQLLRLTKTNHWHLLLCKAIPNLDTLFLYDPLIILKSPVGFKTGSKTYARQPMKRSGRPYSPI